MLTDEQIDQFRGFGFVTLRGVLDSKRLDSINREFESCIDDAYKDKPFDGSDRHWVPLLTEKAPTFSAFAEEKFFELAERLLGEKVVLLLADGNRYVGDTPWHSDFGPHLQGVKFATYLDSVDAGSGALRVVPGSHRNPMHSSIKEYMERHVYPREVAPTAEIPAIALPSEPGDVVAFNPPIWHASVGGGSNRRMCTWDYFTVPDGAEGREHIREFTSNLASVCEKMWPERRYPFYDKTWIENVENNAHRRQMVDRMRDTGVFSAAGIAA